MGETPKERAERIYQGALAASKKKAEIAKESINRLKGSLAEGEQSLIESGKAGSDDIRYQGALALSGALGGAAQTGSGARLAAARSVGDTTGRAMASAQAKNAAQLAQYRLKGADALSQAETSAQNAALEDLKFQKDAQASEQNTLDLETAALNEINALRGEYNGTFTEDEEGMAKAIRNVAAKYQLKDPDLYNRLMELADYTEQEVVQLEDGPFTHDDLYLKYKIDHPPVA